MEDHPQVMGHMDMAMEDQIVREGEEEKCVVDASFSKFVLVKQSYYIIMKELIVLIDVLDFIIFTINGYCYSSVSVY